MRSLFLPATQEQQSILESIDLKEYVKQSDDKIKGCANVDPDVCEVKLTQELEVLISVSDTDDESGASQEPTLDRPGYTYAVVNKKTDETNDCTIYYNVNFSPKRDNKCYHWYENVGVGCKSVNVYFGLFGFGFIIVYVTTMMITFLCFINTL